MHMRAHTLPFQLQFHGIFMLCPIEGLACCWYCLGCGGRYCQACYAGNRKPANTHITANTIHTTGTAPAEVPRH